MQQFTGYHVNKTGTKTVESKVISHELLSICIFCEHSLTSNKVLKMHNRHKQCLDVISSLCHLGCHTSYNVACLIALKVNNIYVQVNPHRSYE